jgi:hypothetical protein
MQFKIVDIKTSDFEEETQCVPVRFAFAKINRKAQTVEPQHGLVLCRDFLLDTLIWLETPALHTNPIYGYFFNEKINKIPTLLLDNIKITDLTRLHTIEKMFGVKPSCLYPTDEEDMFVIRGDPFWYKSTVYLSFWTYCIRYLLGTDAYSIYMEIPFEKKHFWPRATNTDIFSCALELSKLDKNPQTVRSMPTGKIHGPNGFIMYLNFPQKSTLKPE